MFIVILVLLVTRCEPCSFGSFLKNDLKVVKMFRKPDYFIKKLPMCSIEPFVCWLGKNLLHCIAWPCLAIVHSKTAAFLHYSRIREIMDQ